MPKNKLSEDSIVDATRERATFSGHGEAKGASGYTEAGNAENGEFLSSPGQTTVVNPHDDGFGTIRIGAAWENIVVQQAGGVLDRFIKQTTRQGVDIDLGCLYELHDETRGCIQAFGEMMGDFESAPFISLSGDERTGDTEGDDEFLLVNGAEWGKIKRLLIYAYIYEGAPNWASTRPQIQVSVPGEQPMVVVPAITDSNLTVCALAMLENVRDGIRLTNHSEYFPGHAEMDRAFGFGLEWADGQKR